MLAGKYSVAPPKGWQHPFLQLLLCNLVFVKQNTKPSLQMLVAGAREQLTFSWLFFRHVLNYPA